MCIMISSTKEPPPIPKEDNPKSQDGQHFDDQDDDLLSQAYDSFITQTHSVTISQTSNEKENNSVADEDGNENISLALLKDVTRKEEETEHK